MPTTGTLIIDLQQWKINTIDVEYTCGPTWPEIRKWILKNIVNLV